MKYYPKIHAPFKRDTSLPHHPLLIGIWSKPEFEYLEMRDWLFTEKLDGMNIAIEYTAPYTIDNGHSASVVPGKVVIHGRTSRSQVPEDLHQYLKNKFRPEVFERAGIKTDIILYGEGMGPRINGGGKYFRHPEFVLFDAMVGDWILLPEDVSDVANKLGCERAPIIGEGHLWNAIRMVRQGLTSEYGDFEAEGIVAVPKVPLFNRAGERVITKIKAKDFK